MLFNVNVKWLPVTGLVFVIPLQAQATSESLIEAQETQAVHSPTARSTLQTIVVVADNEPKSTTMLDNPNIISDIHIDADTLKHERRMTLGETLSKQPGVQVESYGAASGNPVIRAYSGQRVTVLNDGISAEGASLVSSNYPLAMTTSHVESIQVFKTGAATRFGGSAIGGAITTTDGLVPKNTRQTSESALSGNVDIAVGYNSGDRQSVKLSGHNNGQWAWQIQAARHHIDDIKIPNQSKSAVCYDMDKAGENPTARMLCQVSMPIITKPNPAYYPYFNDYFRKYHPDEKSSDLDDYTNRSWFYESGKGIVRNTPNPDYVAGTPDSDAYITQRGPIKDVVPSVDGKLPNSHALQQSYGIGGSYFGEGWRLGTALRHHTFDYGVPAFANYSTKTKADLLAPIDIESQMTQWQVEADINHANGWLKSTQVSYALTDQKTKELVGNQTSTELRQRNHALNSVLNHGNGSDWQGQFGTQWSISHLDTSGVDRYLPNVDRQQKSLFLLEQLNLGKVDTELGYRHDWVDYTTDSLGFVPSRHAVYGYGNRDFDLSQYHGTVSIKPLPMWKVAYTYSHAERAPSANELYAGNKHYAILADEAGDANLNAEQAKTHEISTQIALEPANLKVSYYDTKYKDYIHLGYTGIDNGGVYSKQWRQGDHHVSGIDAELSLYWQDAGGGDWTWRIFGDWVKNHIDNPDERFEGSNIAALPVNRYGTGLDWNKGAWSANVSATHYTEQDHLGKSHRFITEIPLPSYTLVDARLGYQWQWQGERTLETYLEGHNLTNADARAHNSPVKYLAPLAGRSVLAGVTYKF